MNGKITGAEASNVSSFAGMCMVYRDLAACVTGEKFIFTDSNLVEEMRHSR